MDVSIKREIGPIDGTPEKRMFWSIVSDYDLKTGLCELIDNAFDVWLVSAGKHKPKIEIELDVERQTISVQDNVGGVRFEDLHLLLAPGGSKNDPGAQVIGIFGVGSKRASIALGEHVEIRTRFRRERSLQLDITKDWLESDDWRLAAYEIPVIDPGTTRVDISKLRRRFDSTDIGALRVHFGQTYAWFLKHGGVVELNRMAIVPEEFDAWAYPPGFSPKRAIFEIQVQPYGKMNIDVCVVACTRFRRHQVRCFNGTGGASWSVGSLRASSSLRLCG